jgi:long-subunit fatty acid transport protein
VTEIRRRVLAGSATAAFAATALVASTAQAGGLLLYEFGTAEPGLAAAGYAARAQDASTAFTNPAGMTRLDGTQVLVGGQRGNLLGSYDDSLAVVLTVYGNWTL